MVDPREHPRVGTMQYQETLPLRDHEVVLTFDDGPLPPHSLQVLDILARECVKATFFTVGQMARNYPQYLRRVLAAGHSIGTHSQNHLLSMHRMPIERARQEIDDGIASAAAALSDPAAVAPFMRIPGLMRAKGVEDYLASNGIQLWSADFPADDWRHISAERVYQLAISRIEAKRKGILLLHDIQARTVAALPRNPPNAEGARLPHCSRGADHAEPTEDDHGAARLADASCAGNRRDRASARSSGFQLCQRRHTPRFGDLGLAPKPKTACSFARGFRPVAAFRSRSWTAVAGKGLLAAQTDGRH